MPRMLRIVKPKPAFDLEAFLRSAAIGTTGGTYEAGHIVFSQGDVAGSVMFLQAGAVKLSVFSRRGKEAVIAVLEPGAFFGESALAGPVRHETGTAITAATVLIIPKQQMIRLLHQQQEFSDRFIAYMLARNIRIEEDVVDQLFNSSEKRLARALLLLAHCGTPGKTHRVLPRISQQTLADMIGTTRPRVNFFLREFKQLGYIEYRDGLTVNDSLRTVLQNDHVESDVPKAG
jgi:CRP/FNR family transcriptional regulator, cyclic AMP receptor protein